MHGDETKSDGHLTVEEAASFATGSLDPARRAELGAHMATCGHCRREVAHVVRVLRPERLPRMLRYGSLALAAAVLLFVLVPPDSATVDGESPLRATDVPDAVVQVVSPPPVTTSADEARRFVWRSAGPGARYEFKVTTSDGAPLWAFGTGDTSVTLPTDVRLAPNQSYLWFLDALLPDGRSLTSGVRQLRTPP
jgi:hypothetical protein